MSSATDFAQVTQSLLQTCFSCPAVAVAGSICTQNYWVTQCIQNQPVSASVTPYYTGTCVRRSGCLARPAAPARCCRRCFNARLPTPPPSILLLAGSTGAATS